MMWDHRPGERHARTPASRQAQPVPAVSGMGCGLCGSSRSRMAFNAWVWGDSDRGSKSTSRRSAVIRTARSLSVRSSRCIMPNMARKRSDGKARPPARPCERSRRWPRSRTSSIGFNQPTYRGVRINGQRVATWSSRDGWSQGYKARCGVAPMKISVADNIWKSSLVERTSK